MADRVVAVGEAGSIYERADGSRYFLNAYSIGDPIPCDGNTGQPCGLLVPYVLPTLDPSIPARVISERERLLDEQLSDEAAAALTVGGISQTSYAAQNLSAYLPGGLPQLLQLAPPIAETIDAETQAFVADRYASDDPYQLRSPGEQLTGISTLRAYEQTLARTALPEVQALVAAERERNVGLLDDLGLSGFAASSSFPTLSLPSFNPAPSFDFGFGQVQNPGGTVNSAGAPVFAETGGGIIDTLSNVFQTAIPYIPNILTALSNAGVIRGDVGDAFRTPLPMQTPSGGVTPTNMGATTPGGFPIGFAQDPCEAALREDGYLGYGLCKVFGQGAFGLPQNEGTQPMTMPLMPTSPQQLWINSGLGGGCGRRTVARVNISPTTHMSLFNQCGGVARRIFVDAPNGQTYILYNAGPATIGANERGLAKRIAKRSGLKLVSRASGGRTYRRRRPR